MLKSELYKIIKSKKSIFFCILILLIPFIDLIQNIHEESPDTWIGSLPKCEISIPSSVCFLSGGSQGHISQMLLIWILPIYLLLIYSDSYIREIRSGYSAIIFSKQSRSKIVAAKMTVAFMVPFLVCLVSLILNFVLVQLIFKGGTDGNIFVETPFEKMCHYRPNITYLVYILVFCLIAGGCGVFCMGLSMLFPGKKFVYPIAFFVWIKQINASNSLTFAMQPFIEYGPEYIIPALQVFFSIVLVVFLLAFIKKVKRDEIFKDSF